MNHKLNRSLLVVSLLIVASLIVGACTPAVAPATTAPVATTAATAAPSGNKALVGVVLGLAGAALGPRLVQSLELEFAVNPWVMIAGAALSAVLAIAATLYPASRAARLDPASALRGV